MQQLCICVVLAFLLAMASAQSDAFMKNNLLVYRIGDATTTASTGKTTTVPIYIDYYDSSTGAKLNSYPAPTSDAGSTFACTHSDSARYTGHLSLAADRNLVGFGCFRASVGTSKPESADSKVFNRVIAYMPPQGTVDTTTAVGAGEGDRGVGTGYITSVLNPLTGADGPVSCLISLSGNSLTPYHGIRMIERYVAQQNWGQQADYGGDNVRSLAMSDPVTPTSNVSYAVAGNVFQFVRSNTRFETAINAFNAAGDIPNDPNGIAAIKYNGITYYYMTDVAAPQRIYKAFLKNNVGQSSYYINNRAGEYFGITARLDTAAQVVRIYVTYRPKDAAYSEIWEFTDTPGEDSFYEPLSMKKLAVSAENTLFRGISFTPLLVQCQNGVQDLNFDTGVDCGGRCAAKCTSGQSCANPSDCESNSCVSTLCAAATCSDNIRNQGETDVDCGGPNCAKCDAPKSCSSSSDCVSKICNAGVCTTASCFDGVQNQDETGVDCGGQACVNINNGKCPNGQACTGNSQCVSNYCATSGFCAVPGCDDGVKNGAETDVDCGGGSCPRCAAGKSCSVAGDCRDFNCPEATRKCVAATCSDGIGNGEEPTNDCGEWCRDNESGRLCNSGERCWSERDCNKVACLYDTVAEDGRDIGFCQPASCSDGFKNGFETDIDCSRNCPNRCAYGKGCSGDADCQENYCNAGKCDTPRCDDGIKNGGETDVDCGGDLCAGALNITCAAGEACVLSGDCDFYGGFRCVGKVCVSLTPNGDLPPTPEGTPSAAPVPSAAPIPVSAPVSGNAPGNGPSSGNTPSAAPSTGSQPISKQVSGVERTTTVYGALALAILALIV